MTDERAKLLSSLRASTITLLGYDDVEHLTAAQQIRIDRAITLRLTIDDLQARQLRGERIDVSGFVEASESLERMVGGNPLEASTRFGPDHRERLRQLIENALRGSEEQDAEDEATMALRDEAMAIAASSADGVERAERLLADKSSNCVGGDGVGGIPRQQPAKQQSDNVVAIDNTARANAARPPDHYLAERREPWQQGGATFTVPSFPIDPRR
jgi:hypothetical protein